MSLRTRTLSSAVLPLLVALLASLPAPGRAQGDAIDSLLTQSAPDQTASREDAPDAPSDPVAPESWLQPIAPPATAPRAVAPAGDAICRVMTDMAQRSRRERVCMSRAGWEALVRVAKGSGARAAGGARLKLAYRSRSER